MEMWKCHTTGKQTPYANEDTQVFWEGCRRHRLLIQQCDQCGEYRFPPSPLCAQCLSSAFTWQEDPGDGEVLTYCVYHSTLAGPAWQAELPYVVAVVQLCHSHIKILSNLVVPQERHVFIGMPVRLGFEQRDDSTVLPKFFPALASGNDAAPNAAVAKQA